MNPVCFLSSFKSLKHPKKLTALIVNVAERGGFEPPVRSAYNGFRDRPVRPLRHLSWYVAKIEKIFYHCRSQKSAMMNRLCCLLLIWIILLPPACNRSGAVIKDETSYEASIEKWRQDRLERLKGENGWLNLAGLYWLGEGENTFGSDPSNDIVFPGKARPFCGTLTLRQGRVILRAAEGSGIFAGKDPVGVLELRDDHTRNTTVLRQGDLAWFIIKRGDKYGVRLRDYHHPNIDKLDHIPSYPVQTDYVVEARLVPFDEPETVQVATPVQGYFEEYKCPGELQFKLNGNHLKLLPFISGRQYFLVFADKTTGLETYGSGRFMYASRSLTGRVILDFNKAYNPPCAFTPYATCPMPPKENFLPVAIEAGEKTVHLY
jgi:uncharacterized protein (DUF1684 family)